MNDDELEVTLRRYKGIDPQASLRARVLATRQPRLVPVTRYDWCLLTAAAASMVLALASDVELSGPAVSEAEAERQLEVQALAAVIGGDDAIRYAEMLVSQPPLMLAAPVSGEE